MPEGTTIQAGTTQGAATTQTQPDPLTLVVSPGKGGGGKKGDSKPGKTFTQEELDAIIEARLKRAVPSDYDQLKADAKKFRDLEEAGKTELQKAQDAALASEARAKNSLATANARLIRAAIIEAATVANAVDVDTIAALLAGNADITVDDNGDVKGVKPAVTALLKDKPFLVKGAGATGGPRGEFTGTDQATIPERIQQLTVEANQATDPRIRKAKRQEARDLQIQWMQARTTPTK